MWQATIRHELGFGYVLEFEAQPTGAALRTAMRVASAPVVIERMIPFTNDQALAELRKITGEIVSDMTPLPAGTLTVTETWTGHDTYIGTVTVVEL